MSRILIMLIEFNNNEMTITHDNGVISKISKEQLQQRSEKTKKYIEKLIQQNSEIDNNVAAIDTANI